MQRPHRTGLALGAGLSAAALAVAGTLPAQAAATPGWRVVKTSHYGSAHSASAYWTVVAPSRRDAWALGTRNLAGGAPVAVHWNGKSWRTASLPGRLSGYIAAASASSSSNVWAVTHAGGAVLHWNGHKWSLAKRLASSKTATLSGVTAVSPSNVWVFGATSPSGTLGTWHFNGRSWTKMGGTAAGLDYASAVSRSDIWGIRGTATAPASALVRFNGRQWQHVRASALSGTQFTALAAVSRTNVWVAGVTVTMTSETPWLAHLSGSHWKRIKMHWPLLAGKIASDGRGGAWATATDASGNSWALHLSRSGRWSRTLLGSRGSKQIEGLTSVPGTTALWGVGLANTKKGTNAVIWEYGRAG